MKILVVNHTFPPFSIGGTGIHAYRLSKALSRRGHEVHILVRRGSSIKAKDRELIKEFPLKGLHIHRVIPDNVLPRTEDLRWLRFVFEVRKILKSIYKSGFDIIHAHGPHGGFPLLNSLEIPYIVTVHGNFMDQAKIMLYQITSMIKVLNNDVATYYLKSFMGASLHALFEKIACELADLVITLSNYEKRRLHEVYEIPYRKMITIPNFVDYDEIQGILSTSATKILEEDYLLNKLQREDSFKVVYAGFLNPVKGLRFLLEAVKIIRNKGVKFKLIIAGTGPLERELNNIITKERLEKYVLKIGFVPYKKLLIVYSLANCVVVPSLFEGIPTTMLEAMAVGKPVIASRVGGIPEVIKDGVNGLLVEPGNPYDLAEKIMMLSELRDLRLKLGENAKMTVENNYDVNIVAERIEQIYQSLIND